jgi:DNA-binding HxlR family transcriptional regulator
MSEAWNRCSVGLSCATFGVFQSLRFQGMKTWVRSSLSAPVPARAGTALPGLRRFDEFQRNLGIARKVLADRLRWLVDEGILERVPYQERPKRYEYHLTAKGRDLHVALVGLRQWGDDYCSEKPPMLARTKSDKKPVIAALVPRRSDHLRLEEVEFVPGPGRGSR